MSKSDRDILLRSLKRHWGYNNFKINQFEICSSLMHGNDCSVLMATGSGKSLNFQLPAVALRDNGIKATSIIVSPLLSLIDDQVSSLLSVGISCCALGSTSSVETERRAQLGEFSVIYATPEKITMWTNGLCELKKHVRVVCLAIDESHCVSEWGNDFRPTYRQLGQLRQVLGFDVPVIALTASATERVLADITSHLQLRNPRLFKSTLNRPNLKYSVLQRTSASDLVRVIYEFRKEQLQSLHQPGGGFNHKSQYVPFHSTLIYANTKKETEELAKLLVECRSLTGVKVAYYHASMSTEDRRAVHQAFSKDEVQIVIATIAFGMGINKPDIRLVVHYGMPKNVEAYYQQTGRAGRDGLPSRCILLYARQDIVRCFNITCGGSLTGDASADEHVRKQLADMAEYATSANECRRRYMLRYFNEMLDEEQGEGPSVICCDLCDAKLARTRSVTKLAGSADSSVDVAETAAQQVEVGEETFMLLKTVIDCGEVFGIATPLAILTGHHDKSVQRISDYMNMEYFGRGSRHSAEWWKAFAYQLVDREKLLEAVLTKNRGSSFSYQRYVVTAKGRSFLLSGRPASAKSSPGKAEHGGGLIAQLLQEQAEQDEVSAAFTYPGGMAMKYRPAVHGYRVVPHGEFERVVNIEQRRKAGNSVVSSTSVAEVQQLPIPKPIAFQFVPKGMALQLHQPAAAAATAADVLPGNATEASAVLSKEKEEADKKLELASAIRRTRNDIAAELGINPYNVLTAQDIDQLLCHLPLNAEELGQLAGWGDWKKQHFGGQLCETIGSFVLEHGMKRKKLPNCGEKRKHTTPKHSREEVYSESSLFGERCQIPGNRAASQETSQKYAPIAIKKEKTSPTLAVEVLSYDDSVEALWERMLLPAAGDDDEKENSTSHNSQQTLSQQLEHLMQPRSQEEVAAKFSNQSQHSCDSIAPARQQLTVTEEPIFQRESGTCPPPQQCSTLFNPSYTILAAKYAPSAGKPTGHPPSSTSAMTWNAVRDAAPQSTAGVATQMVKPTSLYHPKMVKCTSLYHPNYDPSSSAGTKSDSSPETEKSSVTLMIVGVKNHSRGHDTISPVSEHPVQYLDDPVMSAAVTATDNEFVTFVPSFAKSYQQPDASKNDHRQQGAVEAGPDADAGGGAWGLTRSGSRDAGLKAHKKKANMGAAEFLQRRKVVRLHSENG